MKSAGFLLTLGLGMAAGAMVFSMLPQRSEVRKAVDHAADSLEELCEKTGLRLDGLTAARYVIPAGYHSGAGTVTLTDDIEAALALI